MPLCSAESGETLDLGKSRIILIFYLPDLLTLVKLSVSVVSSDGRKNKRLHGLCGLSQCNPLSSLADLKLGSQPESHLGSLPERRTNKPGLGRVFCLVNDLEEMVSNLRHYGVTEGFNSVHPSG